jgi:hypothetical protein
VDGILAGESYTWSAQIYLSTSSSTVAASCTAAFDIAPAASVFPGNAQWIGGGGQVRSNPLSLPAGTVARARAYVTGVGSFYLYVNGVKVGKNIMDPPQTVYSKTILYSTFDVASLLKPGANYVGAFLGTYKWGYTDLWCNMTVGSHPLSLHQLSHLDSVICSL